MLLIGMFDSPFVRRVAISLLQAELPFEHAAWSVGRDLDRIRERSPLGRVPALVLDDGEVLTDSAAILDWIDDTIGAERALLPPAGRPRRDALRLIALAIGAAEKARDGVYERRGRPPEKVHLPWAERLEAQMHGALGVLEQHARSREAPRWLVGERFSQADISVACAVRFTMDAGGAESGRYPALAAHSERCEHLPPFVRTRVPFRAPAVAASS
jgi:glutathione S-transferase